MERHRSGYRNREIALSCLRWRKEENIAMALILATLIALGIWVAFIWFLGWFYAVMLLLVCAGALLLFVLCGGFQVYEDGRD